MTTGEAVFAVIIVLYAAVAVKLGRWSVTMPMIFVILGFVLGSGGTGLLTISPRAEGLKGLVEITLALLLFADASTIELRKVREDARLPGRLLGIGMPLTIVFGAIVALVLLRNEGIAFAALLGAILAPTDAALGLPIFNDPKVPVRIRRALNVESGLNDGIATPFVALFLAYAVATEEHAGTSAWLTTALAEIGLAVLVGIVVGIVGGWLMVQTTRRGWTSGSSAQIGILGLALAAYFCSLAIGGNGFIAAFVGGIVFGAVTRNRLAEPTEFTETAGTFMSLLVWAIFGTVLVTAALSLTTDWRPIVYAVLSLTAIRMIAVAIAMRGSGLRRDTIGLMGWFGPRGLASVVFTLLAWMSFNEADQPADTLIAVATWTILLSVVAHGLSAKPLAAWYAGRLAKAAEPPLELADAPELRARRQMFEGGPGASTRAT
jgi:sodium/hydrogen antiporter